MKSPLLVLKNINSGDRLKVIHLVINIYRFYSLLLKNK